MAVTAPTTPGTYYLIDNEHQRSSRRTSSGRSRRSRWRADPRQQPPPNLTPTGPVPDLYTVKPDQHRTFEWSIVDAADGSPTFPINGFLFPESPIVPIQVGQVEEWLLVNTSSIDHVFHIHQTDLAVIRSGTNSISTGPSDQSLPLHVVTRFGRHPAGVERDHPLPRQPPSWGNTSSTATSSRTRTAG